MSSRISLSLLSSLEPITSNALNHPPSTLKSGVKQLNDFQKFVLQQIEQLQHSSLSKQSTSNVVAVENRYGELKESIINYYFEERAAKKQKDMIDIATEVGQLKFKHAQMKKCIQQAIHEFYNAFREELACFSQEMSRLEEENRHLKIKVKEISISHRQILEENKQLKRNLHEWQQAKQRRRMKQERKDEPSVQKIQQIIQKKLTREDNCITKHMTPLKQFNMQNYMGKKISSFNFALSMAVNHPESQTAKKFRTSSISEMKNLNQFSSVDICDENQKENQRRKSKQKLKVFSIDHE